jgi:putative SOS response-associated peptidase YedK
MPVIVEPADYDAWLSGDARPSGYRLTMTFPEGMLDASPVSWIVNIPRSHVPECTPVEEG